MQVIGLDSLRHAFGLKHSDWKVPAGIFQFFRLTVYPSIRIRFKLLIIYLRFN